MKKFLALILAIAMLGCFAACGGSDSSTESTASEGSAATSIKFSAETYEVKVGGYKMVSEGIIVEPAGAKVIYEVSDENLAVISKKGEVEGIKEGTVTVTAKSEDGKVTATCTVYVKGYGTIVAYDEETKQGGITNKRFNKPEKPEDTNAIIVIISKNIDKSVDKTNITALNYGEEKEDGYCLNIGEGFYVARTNEKGNFVVEDVPTGEYVGLIISSNDYTKDKTYDNSTIAPTLKTSELGEYLSEAEINALAACAPIQSREFYVGELKVEAGKTTVFGHAFNIDTES